MAVYFISDLHLDAANTHLSHLFFKFLRHHLQDAEALYILGDLFEAWVGDDDISMFNQQVIQSLADTAKKMPVYLMPGNRDFLLGPAFAKAAHVKLLADPAVIDLYGQKTLLMHGDSLCTHDRKHQSYRKFVRSPCFQRGFSKLPLAWRKAIAQRMRKDSTQRNRRLSETIMDVNFAEIPRIMRRYQVKQMIYGHTHRPAIHWLSDHQDGFYRIYVLSDWHERGNALICRATGERSLVYFCPSLC